MSKYAIPPTNTLREVYLMWLIANDPKEFASENGLNSNQLFAFRNVEQYTWQEFEQERISHDR